MGGEMIEYTVQSGDTLWSITRKFKVDIEELKLINNLIDDVIYQGQSLIIPKRNQQVKKLVAAYQLYSDEDEGIERLNKVKDNLNMLIPCWLDLNLDGQIKENISSEIVRIGKEEGLKVVALLKNYNFEKEIIDDFLSNKKAKEDAIESIVKILDEYHLDGINIDFEYVSPTNRSYLNNFIYKLTDAVRDLGALVTISVPAKVKEDISSNWSGAFDYQTVGNYADQVMIMGYDYHWCGGSPGPIAPIYWLEDVIKYSLLEIPKEKLILGLPTYGYDWELESNNFAQALSYSEIMKLLSKYDVDYYWDEEAATSYFKYQSVEEEHIVWFENLKSIKKKLDLIRKYELGGVVFWRLGLEDERIWTEIEKGL